MTAETDTLQRLRAMLMATLLLGILGTGTELLLLGHTDGWQQLMPIALLGAGFVACVANGIRPSTAAVRLLQVLMLLFMTSGTIGVFLHYRGNVDFEREMYPAISGRELFTRTVTGATPILAPGTMLVLGLVGLAHTYRHSRTTPGAAVSAED